MPQIHTADRVVVQVTATESGDWQVVSSATGMQGITSALFADNDLIHGFVVFENGEDWEVYDGDAAADFLEVLNASGTVTLGRPASPFSSSNNGDRVDAGTGTHTLTISLGAASLARIFRETNPMWTTFTAGDATPSVAGARLFKTNGGTAITRFDDVAPGQVFHVVRGDADVTIENSASLVLSGGQDFTLTEASPSATFVADGAVVRQIGGGGADTTERLSDVAALRAYTGSAPLVRLTQNHAAGDGGGWFELDTADTSTADDHGWTIVTGAGLRYRRVTEDGKHRPEFYAPTATSDDHTAFSRCHAGGDGLVWLRANRDYRLSTDFFVTRDHGGIVQETESAPSALFTQGRLILNQCSVYLGSPAAHVIGARIKALIDCVDNTAPGVIVYSARYPLLDIPGHLGAGVVWGDPCKTITAIASDGGSGLRLTIPSHGYQSGLLLWVNAKGSDTGLGADIYAGGVITVVDANTIDIPLTQPSGLPYAGSDTAVRAAPHVIGGVMDHHGSLDGTGTQVVLMNSQAGGIRVSPNSAFEAKTTSGGIASAPGTANWRFARGTNVFDRFDHLKGTGAMLRGGAKSVHVDNTRVVSLEFPDAHMDDADEATVHVDQSNPDFTGGGVEIVNLHGLRGKGYSGATPARFPEHIFRLDNSSGAQESATIMLTDIFAHCRGDAVSLNGQGPLTGVTISGDIEIRAATADRAAVRIDGDVGAVSVSNLTVRAVNDGGTVANALVTETGSTGEVAVDADSLATTGITGADVVDNASIVKVATAGEWDGSYDGASVTFSYAPPGTFGVDVVHVNEKAAMQAGDVIATQSFQGRDDGGTTRQWFQNQYQVVGPTWASGSGRWILQNQSEGAYGTAMVVGRGLAVGNAVDEARGVINVASGYMVNSNTVADADGLLRLRSYTIATLPSSATPGRLVWLTDEAGGPTLAVSDGTDWRRMSDNAIVT